MSFMFGIPGAVGRILNMLWTPCDTTPSLWAEAAVPAALTALWTIIEPDPKELYHRAFGHSLVCSMKTAIVEASAEAPVMTDGSRRFLFRAAEWVDMSVWYMFLASVGSDMLIDWITSVYRMSGCIDDPYAHAGSGYAPFGACPAGGKWGATAFDWWFDAWPYAPASPTLLELEPGDEGVICVAAQATDVHDIPCSFSTRIIIEQTGQIIDQNTAPGASITNPNIATIVKGKYKNYGNSTVIMRCQGGSPEELPTDQCFPKNGYCFMRKYHKGQISA